MTEATYYTIILVCVSAFAILHGINCFIQSRKYYQLTIDGETFQVVFNLDISRWSKTVTFTDLNYIEHTMTYNRIELYEIKLKEHDQ